MPTQTRNDRRDLILARAEASRLRRLEEQQIREAQEMVCALLRTRARGAYLVRRRSRRGRHALIGVFVAIVVAVVAASLLIPDYGDNRAEAGSMPPQAANHIAQKNDNAALNAAAAMRAQSARDARIADQAQDQVDRANAAQPAR